MRVTFRVWLVCVAAVLAAGTVLRAADSIRIVPLVHDDEVLVSVDFDDAYTSSVREAISSGLRTTISYDVELRMAVPLWVDRTVATAVVSTSDQYDNLTRRHTLLRTVDGHVEETSATEDEQVARRWLTTLSRVPLCRTSTLEATRDYYVRIRARVRPSGMSLLGLASAAIGQAKFTYIP